MQRHFLIAGLLAGRALQVAGQAAATTSNPLNNFIGAAGAAASQIKSAASQETSTPTSSSSTTPSLAPTTPPAAASPTHSTAAHHGLSNGAKIGIIVGCVVGAVLLLALLALCCCIVLRRRHKHKRTASPIPEQEPAAWKSPINPGRPYSNYTPAQHGNVPMEQHPTVPLMAAAATEHYRSNHSQAPSLSQHPAMRKGVENPFVPVPPSPRGSRTNSRNGLSDATMTGATSHVIPERQPLRDSGTSSVSRPASRGYPEALPTHTDANRPPTPFGLSGFGTPAGHAVHPTKSSSPVYSGIGQPYEDMHVHVLQTDTPSRELRHSHNNRQTAGVPTTAYDSDEHIKYRNSRGYSTPPEMPSKSPNRAKQSTMFADSSYDSSLSATTPSNSSGDLYQRVGDPYAPAQRENVAPWEQHQHRFSGTPRNADQISAPPIPWEQSEYNLNKQRRQSHSPRQSMQYDGRRRSSRSPATSINGQPRRLRFEDLQAHGGHGYHAVPGQHDSYDGYDDNNRWSQGVGEAL